MRGDPDHHHSNRYDRYDTGRGGSSMAPPPGPPGGGGPPMHYRDYRGGGGGARADHHHPMNDYRGGGGAMSGGGNPPHYSRLPYNTSHKSYLLLSSLAFVETLTLFQKHQQTLLCNGNRNECSVY